MVKQELEEALAEFSHICICKLVSNLNVPSHQESGTVPSALICLCFLISGRLCDSVFLRSENIWPMVNRLPLKI